MPNCTMRSFPQTQARTGVYGSYRLLEYDEFAGCHATIQRGQIHENFKRVEDVCFELNLT